MQWDVGGLACTVAADVERNFGGRWGCSGPSPAVEVVVVEEGGAKESRAPLVWMECGQRPGGEEWQGRSRW